MHYLSSYHVPPVVFREDLHELCVCVPVLGEHSQGRRGGEPLHTANCSQLSEQCNERVRDEPRPDKRQRPQICHPQSQGDSPNYTYAQKVPLEVKKECCHPTHKPPLESILAKRHMGIQGKTMRVTK